MSPWPASTTLTNRLLITDASYGVKVEIDGHELQNLGSITFTAPVDDVCRLEAEMIVSKPMAIDVSAHVTINVMCYGEFEITETIEGNVRRFIVKRLRHEPRHP